MAEAGSVNYSKIFERAATVAVSAVALAAVASLSTCGINAVQSSAEFNAVEAQMRMLVEKGDLTDARTGAPKPYVVKHDGQEFAISVKSALNEQNGVFRDASGQTVADTQTQDGQGGAVRSGTYYSKYTVNGVISRVKGSDAFFRPFYNDGGSRDFSVSWEAGKPLSGPLSVHAFNGGARNIEVPIAPSVVPGQTVPIAPVAGPAPAATPAG